MALLLMNMPFVSHAGPLSSSCCRRLRFMAGVQHTTNRIHEASLAALTSMYSRHSPTDSSKIMLPAVNGIQFYAPIFYAGLH